MFLGSSTQKHAESLENVIKKTYLSQKGAKFDERSEMGHVHEHQKLQVKVKPSRKTQLSQIN